MKIFKKAVIYSFLVIAIAIGSPAKAAGNVNPDTYQRIVITLLYQSIDDAITDYYGEYKRGYDLYDAEISNLESLKGWSKFNVTVAVQTFYGAHNPPRALESLTFYVTLGEKPLLIKYEHTDVETSRIVESKVEV